MCEKIKGIHNDLEKLLKGLEHEEKMVLFGLENMQKPWKMLKKRGKQFSFYSKKSLWGKVEMLWVS